MTQLSRMCTLRPDADSQSCGSACICLRSGEAANDSGAGWAADILVNPIVPACGVAGAADPSVVHWDGFYYYCKSLNDQAIGVARAARLQDIGKVPMLTIWAPPAGTDYSEQIWAPELQLVQGRWYIYFAASDGANVSHRMFVLEANTDDLQGAYTFKGKVTDSTDCWAIDGLTLEHDDGLYFVWSGWRSQADLFPQVTYIARMENPWTIAGERHEIAAPDRTWEQAGAPLMEGHAILRREGKLFVTYSASASWTDDYTLGLLEYTGGDLLQPKSWAKSAAPVFTKLDSASSYGPGHNSFVKSPDGREDWIVYHAIDTSNGGWAQRSVRAQRFEWDQEGRPNFGLPVATGVPIAGPSREALVQTV